MEVYGVQARGVSFEYARAGYLGARVRASESRGAGEGTRADLPPAAPPPADPFAPELADLSARVRSHMALASREGGNRAWEGGRGRIERWRLPPRTESWTTPGSNANPLAGRCSTRRSSNPDSSHLGAAVGLRRGMRGWEMG